MFTLDDLLPTAEQLMEIAIASLLGDPASTPVGKHSRRNIDLVDMGGRSKTQTYDDALNGRLEWFQEKIDEVRRDPGSLPASLRTRVPKASGGTRPIDDPAEAKRLIALFVRDRIGELVEDRLHEGQYGSRPAWAIKKVCPRDGATNVDHLTWQGRELMKAGYVFALLIDLKNAFGLLPRRAVTGELAKLGLDKGATTFLWRLVRIDAVGRWTRKPIRVGNPHVGEEQGNPLSAMVLNLALAPIIRKLEHRLDVKALAYVDDIYIFCRTRVDAKDAFKRFKGMAQSRGFGNVRKLGNGKKDSKIIDSRVEPITILQTYRVTPWSIGLTVEKVIHTWEELRLGGKTGKVGPQDFRRAGSCRATHKRWFRASRVLRVQKGKIDPAAVLRLVQEAEERLRDSHESGDCQIPRGRVHGASPPDPNTPLGEGEGKNEAPAQMHREDTPVPLPMDRTPIGTDRVQDTSSSRGIGSTLPTGGISHLQVLPGFALPVHPIASAVRRSANMVEGVGSSGPSGVVVCPQPVSSGGSGGVGPAGGHHPRSPILSVQDPEVARRILQGESLRFGELFKPVAGGHSTTVSLAGLEDLLGRCAPPGRIEQVVNALLRAGCSRNVVLVEYDPRERFTASRVLLGHPGDRVYLRVDERTVGGLVVVHLRRRPRRSRRPIAPPPKTDAAILHIRSSRHESRVVEVKVRTDGKAAWRQVAVDSPNGSIAMVEATEEVLGHLDASTVTVRAFGMLRTVILPSAGRQRDELALPSNVGLQFAQRQLLKGRHWAATTDGDWLVARKV